MTQTVSTETAKQGFHLLGGHPLNQPCLDFIPTLRLVIETQLLERCLGLRFDAREGIADLVIREQRPAVTVLHHMGRLVGKNNPDLPWIVLDVVGTDQQGISGRMEGTQKGGRTIFGHKRVGSRPADQSGVASDPIPGLSLGRSGEKRSQQSEGKRSESTHSSRRSQTQQTNVSSSWSHSRHAGSNWHPFRLNSRHQAIHAAHFVAKRLNAINPGVDAKRGVNPLHALLMQAGMTALHASEDVIPFPFDGRAIGAELMVKSGSLDDLLAQSNRRP